MLMTISVMFTYKLLRPMKNSQKATMFIKDYFLLLLGKVFLIQFKKIYAFEKKLMNLSLTPYPKKRKHFAYSYMPKMLRSSVSFQASHTSKGIFNYILNKTM